MKIKLGRFTVSAMAYGLALMASTQASALMIGEPQMHSTLGQPLDAWIPVLLESPQEKEALDGFAASLAPSDAYLERALLPPSTTVGPLRLQVQNSNGQVRLHVTSQQPFAEPIVTLLIKVRLGQISLVRELSLLPELPGNEPAPAPMVVAEAPQPVAAATAAPAPPAVAAAPVIKAAVRDKPRRQVQQTMVTAPAVVRAEAPVALPRFQLDESFSSYRTLAAAGQAPQPVAAQAPAAAAPPVEPTAVQARVEEQPSAPPRPSDSGNSVLWALGFAAGLTLLISNGRAKRMWSGWFSRTKATPVPVAAPLPARPSEKASKADDFNVRSDELVPETYTLSPITQKTKSVATAAMSISPERQRLEQLQKQFLGEEAQQKLKLAEAFLDLDRISSAVILMNEVERLKQTVADRRLALVKR